MIKPKTKQKILSAIGMAAIWLAVPTQATILTFDQSSPNTATTNGAALAQSYGDNVAAGIQGGFTYGFGAEGFTPDVAASFGQAASSLTTWTTDYGDLVNIAYEAASPTPLEISLTGQAGVDVQLYGFDLGGWPNTDYTINSVQVFDSVNSALFTATSPTIQGAGGSTSFNFAAPLTSSSLRLVIDASNLAASSDNIGIDNIRFGQANAAAAPVAAPSSLLLVAPLLLLGLLSRRSAWARVLG